MSSRQFVQLKQENTGTKKGLDKLARIFRYGDKLTTNERIDYTRVLIRARGRVIADLMLKGEITHDEHEEEVKGFMSADYLLKSAERGVRVDFSRVTDDLLEFIRQLGRGRRKK